MATEKLNNEKIPMGVVHVGAAAGKAFGKAVKANYENLAKAVSGEKTVKEAAKEYKLPLFEAGKAIVDETVKVHDHNVQIVENIFDK